MKHEVKWGAGFSSILLNLRTGQTLSYEQDLDRIHDTLGGKCYYTSRTGLTGEGYVYLTPDWVLTDTYRTDVGYKQTRWASPIHLPDGRLLYTFVPLAGHKGIDKDSPAVITDGVEELHLVRVDRIADTLIRGVRGDVETLTHIFHIADPDTLKLVPISVKVSVSDFGNVSLWRFLHRFIRLEGFRVYPTSQTLRERTLSLFERDGKWYHINRYHLIDRVWDSDPTLTTPVDGWYRFGDMYYRRNLYSDIIQAFWEAPRTALGGKYSHPALPDTVDYEQDIPLLDWVAKPLQEWEADLRRSALNKAIQDLRSALIGDYNRCISLLESADDSILIKREDSLAAGNCPVGTDRFITEYALPQEGITVGDLKKHPRLTDMLKVWDFRKVLVSVLDADNNTTEEV